MPSTRAKVSKEQKIADIVAAARRQLDESGYGGLSVAAIARELSLAQNAIYWYFPTKDHVFVAAMEDMLDDIAARKPRAAETRDRMLWFTDQLAPVAQLRGAMRERSAVAPVVADFVARLDDVLVRMLTNAFAGRVDEDELPLAIAAFRAAVEGAYLDGLGRQRRRQLLGYLFDRLSASRTDDDSVSRRS